MEEPVAFVFVGMAKPPKLDLAIVAYVWEQAKVQGYIPHHIEVYGYDHDSVITTRVIQTPVSSLEEA